MTGNRDFISGIALIIVSAVLFSQTLGGGIILFEDDIDPMIYPRVITVMLGILGAVISLRGLRRGAGGGAGAPDMPVFTRRTVGIAVVLLVYAGVFNSLGFALSSIFAGCSVAFIMGWRRPIPLAAVNIVAVALIWALFVKGLRIPLPTGTLFW